MTPKYLRSIQWYRQGAAAFPWYISPPWSTLVGVRVFGKKIAVSFGSVVLWMYNGQVSMYWPIPAMQRVSNYYVRRQQRSGKFIAKLYASWKQKTWPAFQKSVAEFHSLDFRQYDDDELHRVFLAFTHQHIATWAEAIFHDAFDKTGDVLLEQALVHDGRTIAVQEAELLMKPVRPLSIQTEELALARLAHRTFHRPRLRRMILRRQWPLIQTVDRNWYHDVVRHRNRYFWMYNDYAHVHQLPVTKFLERIRAMILDRSSWHQALNVGQELRATEKKQKALEDKLDLSATPRRILAMLRMVQVWRDERKAMSQQGSSIMRRFALEYHRRGGLPIELVHQSFWWEADQLLRPTATFRSLLHRRLNGALHVTTRSEDIPGVTGVSARRLHRNIAGLIQKKELQGRSVYPGVVRGTARLMLKQSDFPSFKQGQILVAPNTRPEYVPIMKKAAAIVTEEGGITSHAAIVSRELKIPAVVGVQGILDAVKDGDRIEVDAMTGVVKKL